MLLKAFRALSSGARDRDDPYLDRPVSRRRGTGPDALQQQIQEPLTFDDLRISDSDSDDYGLPQMRKSSFPRHDAHRRNTSREQAEIEYKCPGCGDVTKIRGLESLTPCKYCHIKPFDPRRRHPNRPQVGPLPTRQIRTPGQLEERFRSLYARLGVILHEENHDTSTSCGPQRSPLQPDGEAPLAKTAAATPGPSRHQPPWTPQISIDLSTQTLGTPPIRGPLQNIRCSRQNPKLSPIPSSSIHPSPCANVIENDFLATPVQRLRPVSRGSPDVPPAIDTSPRKRIARPPPTTPGNKPPQAHVDPTSRAKFQLLESLRADLASVYGSIEYLNSDFCSSVRPKITKRSLSESSAISLKSQDDPNLRPSMSRHESDRLNATKVQNRRSFMPTMETMPIVPDGKALLAGHLHDVVSSLADYREERQIGRSTTVARKSTYQTSPHVNYSELHAFDDILTRFTLDVNYCAALVSRSDDSQEKRMELRNKVIQFMAHVVVCCMEVILDLLTSAREEPTAPQGTRYLLLILTLRLLFRPLSPLASDYSACHHAQSAKERAGIFARYEEDARLLLLQQSGNKRSPSSLRDRIIHLCLGRIANLPENIQNVFPRWFANMPANIYVDITRAVQDANIKTIRHIPENAKPSEDHVKKLQDRRFLTEMIGASNIEHFSEEQENLPWYTKRQSAWKLRTSCHALQLLVVSNDIRNDTALRYNSISGQLRPPDDTYQPFPIDYFYTPLLDPAAGRFDIALDFELWDSKKNKFSICQYPFLLTLGTKARILEYDNERRKRDAVRQEWHASKGMSADPYFHLPVRREHIIEDSFRAIRQAVGSLSNITSKKLKVHFDGEEAVDAGGPQKEWFLVLTRKLFSNELGLFYLSDSGSYWFHTACSRPNEYYELVGAVFGLAIYNQTPLFAPFPPFLFKKLAAAAPKQQGTNMSSRHLWRPTLQDLAQLSPDFARTLRQALVNPTVLAGMTFEIPLWQNGKSEYVPLGPDGATREITSSNINEFVDKAVNFLLKDSIARQFTAFARGFHSICGGNALSLFRGEELELLIRGSEDFDLDTLRAAAVYDNWKSPSSPSIDLTSEDEVGQHYPVIRYFWNYFTQSSLSHQRKILQFITGTDRLPPAGIVNLVIKLSRQVIEQGGFRYPSARTCFNQVLLPDCFREDDGEVFERVFKNAIEMAGTGFGMK